MAPSFVVLTENLKRDCFAFELAEIPGGSLHLGPPRSAGFQENFLGLGIDESGAERAVWFQFQGESCEIEIDFWGD